MAMLLGSKSTLNVKKKPLAELQVSQVQFTRSSTRMSRNVVIQIQAQFQGIVKCSL